MKFYGEVRGAKRNKWSDFGNDPDHLVNCPIWNPAITQQILSGILIKISQLLCNDTRNNVLKILGVISITMLTLKIRSPFNQYGG